MTTDSQRHFRTLWVSDVHLGTAACRAADLRHFLEQVTADTIFLVGDIVDLQRMRARPRFPDEHCAVLSRLVDIANGQSRVVFIPGNHDHEFRQVAGSEICGVEICREAEHITAAGLRMLVFHGDILDTSIRKGTNLERFASAAYTMLLEADVGLQRLRSSFGADFAPLSTRIKTRLTRAVEYIRRFENTAAAYAASRGFDAVVCGHIHRPGVREIGGILYANDGDWVEHRTAVAEDSDGTIRLLTYQASGVSMRAPGSVIERFAA